MKLQIPTQLQGFIDNILETTLDLGEIKIHPHPFASKNEATGDEYDRYIHIHKMIINLDTPRTYIEYRQVLKNKVTDEVEPSNLPTPEFVIWESDMSTLRYLFVPESLREGIEIDQVGRLLFPILNEETNEVEVDEDGNPMKAPFELSSHKLLIWLQKNNLIGLYQLIENYMLERINNDTAFREKLDKLA